MESLNAGASSKELGRILKGRNFDASAPVDLLNVAPADDDLFAAAPTANSFEATTASVNPIDAVAISP